MKSYPVAVVNKMGEGAKESRRGRGGCTRLKISPVAVVNHFFYYGESSSAYKWKEYERGKGRRKKREGMSRRSGVGAEERQRVHIFKNLPLRDDETYRGGQKSTNDLFSM